MNLNEIQLDYGREDVSEIEKQVSILDHTDNKKSKISEIDLSMNADQKSETYFDQTQEGRAHHTKFPPDDKREP